MKTNKILGIVCALIFVFVPFTFAGCNNTVTYQYSDLQELYNDIVQSNSDIFENDGSIRVVYNNATLNNLIVQNTPQNQFNKLSGDTDNTFAIFEPTFRASMMVVNEFIKKPYIDQTKFDKKYSTMLYNELKELEQSIAKFKESKFHLENRSTIDVNSATVKSWRNDLFVDYYNMIDVSCDFALDFAKFYENNVLGQKKVGERYVPSYMKLDYLRMVAENARIYTDTVICANYNRVVTSLSVNPSVELMNLYLTIPGDALWNKEGALLTEKEKTVMNAFDLWQNYELVFYQGRNILYNALSMDNYNEIVYQSKQHNNSLDAQQKNILAQVDRFISCESANMYNYINSFTTALLSFINE